MENKLAKKIICQINIVPTYEDHVAKCISLKKKKKMIKVENTFEKSIKCILICNMFCQYPSVLFRHLGIHILSYSCT